MAGSLAIVSPGKGASVSGAVKITVSASSPVSWFNLMVDGVWIASNPSAAAPSYNFTWNSSRVARGAHTISVVGYNNKNATVATSAINVNVQALTYYIAPSGSDTDNGLSRTTPFATVGKAAATMIAGDKAIVTAGTYNEVVNVTTSGISGRPITFQADSGAQPVVEGFQIQANYVTITGFGITNQNMTAPAGYGIYLVGSNVTISNNYIHDLFFEGLMMSGNGDPNSAATANNVVQNNRFVRCEMAAVQIEGRNNLVVGNDVSFTRQYPAGGPVRPYADADAFRFFGIGNTFRSNKIHDIYWGTAENPSPHVDCFQTWGPASAITIERNFCQWPQTPTPDMNNEVAMISNDSGTVSGITFRNNVFVQMRQGIHLNNVQTASILNNTFVGILEEGAILAGAGPVQIENNIFYNVGAGQDSYVCADPASQSNLQVAANDQFVPGGAVGTFCGNPAQYALDPLFNNVAGLDLRLQSNSPMIHLGPTLPQVTNDYDGAARPISGGYDLGALQTD
ncbi:MAG TPA: right-handed parallel beta-helix repeat-containing protein [Candidatus Binataceae bacterium]|nr:right-handed parallel beta-helix repeat-containing protein [Candidatus Binataceae bacterium]